MNIDSSAHIISHTERVSYPPGEWWGASTTYADTPMPDFNNPVRDPDDEVPSSGRIVIDDEEPKFYRQVINRPNAN
jgi:hypothetical protein